MNTLKVKTSAFMTAPRYENVWARNIIEGALKRCKIPLVVSQGVFYGQCMQNMLEDAIANGIELAITVDFDSLFTDRDVKHLMARIMGDDKIDALAALQSRRGMPYPLFTHGPDRQIVFNGEPLEVTTAHFGLTCIKLDRLKDVPKPWFWSTPSTDGTWGDEKKDEDIYFWDNWRNNGRTVYVDGSCNIGHLEEVVAGFQIVEGPEADTATLKHSYQYMNDWYQDNVKAHDASNKTDNTDDAGDKS